jgi:hypothetical protein
MAHVRVQRLGAGHGEQHRAEHQERRHAVARQEAVGVARIERLEDARVEPYVPEAGRGQREEP